MLARSKGGWSVGKNGVLVAVLLGVAAACATATKGPTTAATRAGTAAPVTTAPADAVAAPRAPQTQDLDVIVDGLLERIAVPIGGPSRGPSTAKVTIVEFGEFQCPFCARAAPTLERIAAEHPHDVRIFFRHLPLPFHAQAPLAAEAAVAADVQGKFWQMHDRLFDNQQALERASLDERAAAIGLDPVPFRAALDGHAGKATVDADVALAGRLGVQGTPSFFINGRYLGGAQPYEEFRRVIDDEIARADRLLARGVAPADLYATFVARARSALAPGTTKPPPAGREVYAVPVADVPARGAAQPKVTIVAFTDFQCPFSARSSLTMAQLLADYGGDVALVHRHLPLGFHLQAMPAALAAEAAREQGKFWEMHDKLYANQENLAAEDLERYARELDLDLGRFRRSMKKQSGMPRVRRDMDLAARFGARGTPNFFINGRNLRGAQAIEAFKQVINEEIAKADAKLAAGTPRADLYAALTGGGLQAAPDPARPEQPDSARRFRVDVTGAPARGAADALVTIVEWADLQCPFCRRVEPTLARVLAAHEGNVRLVWRDLPLPTLHPEAEAAAMAARAAGEQGRFWEMHDRILGDRDHLDRATFERYAEEMGLDMQRFRTDLNAETVRAGIDDDVTAGAKLGARGTPSFFVNGRYLGGAQPFEVFETMIADELRIAEAMVARGTPRAKVYAALMKDAAPEFKPSKPEPSPAPAALTAPPAAPDPHAGQGSRRRATPARIDGRSPR